MQTCVYIVLLTATKLMVIMFLNFFFNAFTD